MEMVCTPNSRVSGEQSGKFWVRKAGWFLRPQVKRPFHATSKFFSAGGMAEVRVGLTSFQHSSSCSKTSEMKACRSLTFVMSFARAFFFGFFFGTGFMDGLFPWHRASFGAQYVGAGALAFLFPFFIPLRISAISSSSSSSSSGGLYSSPASLAAFLASSLAFFFSAAALFASAAAGVNSSSEWRRVFSHLKLSSTQISCSQLKLAMFSLLASTLSVMVCPCCSTSVSQTSTSLSRFFATVSLDTLNSFSVATSLPSTY
mmetsp:Transcript_25483/g.58777  ORF Transcript_25483/g.58777 Transcript_25483/m.58777 type:complete len:259 (-) Transcript_25483:526-1302(-)